MKKHNVITLLTVITAAALLTAGCSVGTGSGQSSFRPSIEKIDPEDENTEAAQAVTPAETAAAEAADAEAGTAETAADGTAVQDSSTETASAQEAGTSLSYAALRNVIFYFSSGAGGWSTELHIRKDGSFYGQYHDSDMGSITDDAPNGAMYICTFQGVFDELVKVNDYTYSTTIYTISYDHDVDTEEIADGVRYIYTTAYGLDDARTLYFYLPSAPVDKLPEGFISWVRMAMNYEDRKELGFYGLYNESADAGFSGFEEEITAEVLRFKLDDARKQDQELEEKLQSDITQLELNLTAGERYTLWDDLLNTIWDYLKKTMDEDAMRKLTSEQVQWIHEKEAAVAAETAKYEGGSMAPLAGSSVAASMTKDRVLKLMEYVK